MSQKYKNPLLTVDIIIEMDAGEMDAGEMDAGEMNDGIILIERKNPPHGWALPGGFVDYGESLEAAARREAREETSLVVILEEQFQTYSDPARDPRHHTVSTVFIAKTTGVPKADDDAKNLGIFNSSNLPGPIVFDHTRIINDYFRYKSGDLKKAIFPMS